MAFILGQTIKGGRVKVFPAMGGIWLGATCHALVAAFGLSTVLMTSASAFLVLKWLGAVYLFWLGIQALRSKGSPFLSNDASPTVMGSVGTDHPLMQKLGKHKTGKACLYVNKLADIDISVLEKIILISFEATIKMYC